MQFIYLPGSNPPSDYVSRFEDKTDYLTFNAHTVLGSIAVALALGVAWAAYNGTDLVAGGITGLVASGVISVAKTVSSK